MPTAPKRLCHRCRRTTCDCQKKARAVSDRERGTAAERGYDGDWNRFRLLFVGGETDGKSNALCWDCLDEGLVRPMEELHHVVKVRDNPERRLDAANVRPLCKVHHSKRTARGE